VGRADPTSAPRLLSPAAAAATASAITARTPAARGATAGTGPLTAAIDPAQARHDAQQILDGRRFTGAPVPRPLHGVLRWVGDRVSTVTHWIGARFSWLPSPARPVLGALAVAVVVLVIAFAVRAIVAARARTRATRPGAGHGALHDARPDDPAALEVAAAEAERTGDLALAVRLRFRAGLLRLDRDAHAITYRPSIPTVEVRSELGSAAFDGLADTFEDIAYGGRHAEPADPVDAKREWPRVLDAARRR
jgi:hypothetical protein